MSTATATATATATGIGNANRRVIAITGCNRGIGLGLVKTLLDDTTHDTHVIAMARAPFSKELLEINNQHSRCLLVELDVSSSSSHQSALETITQHGITKLDAIIANAGIASKNHPVDPFMTCQEDDMIDLYKTNVIGTMFTLQYLSPLLCTKGICMVMSSRLASIEQAAGTGGYLSYRCSKAALNMLAQTAAGELKPRGIKFLCMHPGWVQTDMGGRNGRKAPVEIIDSVTGIISVLSVALKLQADSHDDVDQGDRGSRINEFCEKFLNNNLVFVGYDFELLPF
jgi:NAD(P)-dependent dehydrogenase (short-subunit alcohol dehydrogenase family)